jgi:hypothetical protein
MRIDADLTQVKEIENLPSGTYSVRCVSEPKIIESKEKKTPGIQLAIVFTDPGTEIAPGVPRLWEDNRTTLWKSREMGWQHFKVKEACEAFGVPFDEKGFDTEHFLNAEAKIAVSLNGYTTGDGKTGMRNEIDHWLKA